MGWIWSSRWRECNSSVTEARGRQPSTVVSHGPTSCTTESSSDSTSPRSGSKSISRIYLFRKLELFEAGREACCRWKESWVASTDQQSRIWTCWAIWGWRRRESGNLAPHEVVLSTKLENCERIVHLGIDGLPGSEGGRIDKRNLFAKSRKTPCRGYSSIDIRYEFIRQYREW